MKLTKSLQSSKGQSLTELALITPIFLILALGIFDYGRVYFAYVSVTNGARTGADYAAANCDASCDAADIMGIRSAVVAETSELLNTSPTNPTVNVNTGGWFGPDHRNVDVTVNYTFSTLIPWPGLPNTMNVERTVRARVRE
ncbi:MAG: pilus assembly protein [Chloroflexi bacterium]|nr:pilus assembly protein [Chloroflexota bacterium]